MKLKIQKVYDGKEKRFLQSISGEDVELLAQFTGKLDKVLHNKRVSYLRKKNQKERKEVSFEANASYLESVSCRIEISVEECIEDMLAGTSVSRACILPVPLSCTETLKV